MGFLAGNTALFIPKFIIHTLTLLGFIHNLISSILRFISLQPLSYDQTRSEPLVQLQSFQELLPVVKFSELVDPLDCCVVCLDEFEAGDEIRLLSNCKHVFHRCCIDRWMDYDRNTCPLCWTPFIPKYLQDSLKERSLVDSGITNYSGDSSLVGSS